MMSLIRPSLTAAILIAAGPAQAVEVFRVEGLPHGETLTIRETPEAGAQALGQIPPGRRVRGFGCTSETPSGLTWCRVKSGVIVGWARRRYLAPE